MNERRMQGFFGEFIIKNPPEESEVYELKFSREKSLAFSSVADHQVNALLAVEKRGLYHRITDQPWIKDRPYSYTLKKPFDCFFLKNPCKAYVVIWFYKARQPKKFIKVRIEDFLRLKDICGRKSFTEPMILEVASGILDIS